jgi:uncharacterized protein (TIGR03643 family)
MANNILNNDLAHQLENKTDEQPGLAPVPRIDLMQHVIFSDQEIDRIIQMAWEDRTPFEAIEFQFGLKEKQVIEFMRKHSLPSSFRMWRKRMKSRKTKHSVLRNKSVNRFKCSMQRNSGNKIAKR